MGTDASPRSSDVSPTKENPVVGAEQAAQFTTIPTTPSPRKGSKGTSLLTNEVLTDFSTSKTGPGSKNQPKSSSPRKISFDLNSLPPNLSRYIQDLAASTASLVQQKSVGAPMKQVRASKSPNKNVNQDHFQESLQFYERRHVAAPVKDETGALRWFYQSLSSSEHTSLLDFYSFLTTKIPALFSQLKSNGSKEMHDCVRDIQLYIRTFVIIKRVHRQDVYVSETCDKALKFLRKAETVLSVHSILPGLGDQTVALIERDEISFLVGHDEQKSAVSILAGCRRSCGNEFSLSGQGAASWRSHNKKRQHSRGQGKDGNREGNREGNNGKKWKQDQKSDKKTKNPKYSGEN